MNRRQRRASAKLGHPSVDREAAGLIELGRKYHKAGKLDEAEGCYRRILAHQPNRPDALYGIGFIAYQVGHYDAAIEWIARATRLDGSHPDWFSNLGLALRCQGRFEESLASHNRALEIKPGYVEAFNDRGNVLKSLGRFEEALASYDRALALNSNYVEAWNNRGVVLKEMNRLEDALLSYDGALALKPDSAIVLTNRANVANELGRLAEALAHYDRALALDPGCADAFNGRGNVMKALGRIQEAEEMFRRAILLRPNSAEAHCNLGGLLVDIGKSDQAEAVLRRAVALNPNFAAAFHNLGTALINLDKSEEAEAAIRRALVLDPDQPGPHHNLSLTLTQFGRLNEAREAAERAIALAPRDPLHFHQLGDVRQYLVDDPYLTALEALSMDQASLDVGKQINLHFALAKAYADIGRSEDEFERLLAGNKLKRSIVDYEETRVLGELDRAQQVFSPGFMRAVRSTGEPSAKPIFIIGMPRSGTSLVEQILASHPLVFGAGELKLFERAMDDVRSAMPEAARYPELALQMSDQHFQKLGGRYLAAIEQLAPAASHITDKMPTNFVFAGLIHLALPNATIIHAMRDPVDTCISCFSKLFTEGNFQTYDLAELGRYCRHYQDLMAHWHQVLPPGRILDVVYEDTVADLEGASRRILAHCGLPWDERCLDFHSTERVVRTSSAAQVRKPIYASSVGRRRAYQAMLGPLLAELSSRI
jgi:tetratricopeptide (TPR) repeat protein